MYHRNVPRILHGAQIHDQCCDLKNGETVMTVIHGDLVHTWRPTSTHTAMTARIINAASNIDHAIWSDALLSISILIALATEAAPSRVPVIFIFMPHPLISRAHASFISGPMALAVFKATGVSNTMITHNLECCAST